MRRVPDNRTVTGLAFFVTSRLAFPESLFSEERAIQIALEALQYYRQRGDIDLYGFAVMPDHIHMCISIPPKYAVSNVVGYIKGKSAIQIARKYGGRQRNFTGESFWARGYYVSTVGLDEAMVRAYIRNQEAEDERYDQMKLVE